MCVCSRISVQTYCMSVNKLVCMCVHVEARDQCGVSSLIVLHLISETGALVRLEIMNSSIMADQQAPRSTRLCFSILRITETCCHTWPFCGDGELNLGSCACMTNTFFTELTPRYKNLPFKFFRNLFMCMEFHMNVCLCTTPSFSFFF